MQQESETKNSIPPYESSRTLEGHERSVSAVKFSPNGELLASAGADAKMIVWDTDTGVEKLTFTGHTLGISDVDWRNDGGYLATASDDKRILLWDLRQPSPVMTLWGHESHVMCVKFSPHQNKLASGSFDEKVILWDIRVGNALKTLKGHADPISAVDFTADGSLIVTGSYDGLCRVWDANSGSHLQTITAPNSPPVSFIQFSPNQRFLLVSNLDNTMRLWGDFLQPNVPLRVIKEYKGHKNQEFATFSAFTKHLDDSPLLVTGSEDSSICLFEVNSRKLIQRLEGHTAPVLTVSCHPTRRMIASGAMSPDKSIRIWEMR